MAKIDICYSGCILRINLKKKKNCPYTFIYVQYSP